MTDRTITLTFGDVAENGVGLQKIGKEAKEGFTLKDLQEAKEWFNAHEISCELIHLNTLLPEKEEAEEAYLLIARNGVSAICSPDEMLMEQEKLQPDTQYYSRRHGKIVNKNARHNLCFSEEPQEANHMKLEGTVVAYDNVPLLSLVRNTLPNILGEKAKDLRVEGNYYYNTKKCYIGWHGDGERRKVVGVRLGAIFPLHFQWYKRSQRLGKRLQVDLYHGDLYIMSEKTVGKQWLIKTIPMVRHAAGFPHPKRLPVSNEEPVKY